MCDALTAHDAWLLRPESKFNRAQESQRAAVARVKALVEGDVTREMMPDELEVLALQLRMESVNLMMSARDLREVEEERRRLVTVMERERVRFESEPGSTGDWVERTENSELGTGN